MNTQTEEDYGPIEIEVAHWIGARSYIKNLPNPHPILAGGAILAGWHIAAQTAICEINWNVVLFTERPYLELGEFSKWEVHCQTTGRYGTRKAIHFVLKLKRATV